MLAHKTVSRYKYSMNSATTRTYQSGNAEVLPLPEGFGFGPGTEVRVEREGHKLVLTPVATAVAELDLEEKRRRFTAMLADMAALGPVPGPRQERDSDWWIDRPFI